MDNASKQPGVPKIFISYRRKDVSGHVGWLYESLKKELGEQKLFRDMDSIRGGDNFREKIETAVASCEILLAVIGPNWLNATDKHGARRLEKEDDFVRLEIEAALKRNIRVVPVLMQEAALPAPEELPASLVGLTERQAIELDEQRWSSDVERLIEIIKDTLPKTGPLPRQPDEPVKTEGVPPPTPPQSASLGPWLIAASALLLAGVVILLMVAPWRAREDGTNPPNSNGVNTSGNANQGVSSTAGANTGNTNGAKTNTNVNNTAVVAGTPSSQPTEGQSPAGQKLAGTFWTYVRLKVQGGTYIIRFNDDENGKTFNFKKLGDTGWAKRDTGETAYGYWEPGENNSILLRWSPYDTDGLQIDTGKINGSSMSGSGGPPTSGTYEWTATKRDSD